MGCDGIFDRMTNLEVQELAWKTIEECKTKYGLDPDNGGLSVHQICGKVVDSLMQNAAREKSFDNLTIVMVAFKGLLDYLNKKELAECDDISATNRNIKIHEGDTSQVMAAAANPDTSINKRNVSGMQNAANSSIYEKSLKLTLQEKVFQNTRSQAPEDEPVGAKHISLKNSSRYMEGTSNIISRAITENNVAVKGVGLDEDRKSSTYQTEESNEAKVKSKQSDIGFPMLPATSQSNGRSPPMKHGSKAQNLNQTHNMGGPDAI